MNQPPFRKTPLIHIHTMILLRKTQHSHGINFRPAESHRLMRDKEPLSTSPLPSHSGFLLNSSTSLILPIMLLHMTILPSNPSPLLAFHKNTYPPCTTTRRNPPLNAINLIDEIANPL